MKQSKAGRYIPFFMVLLVTIACVAFLSEHRYNRVYEVEEEFVCWHDADATNRLSELASGACDYVGPSAAFLFEERLMMYSPTCVVGCVIARIRKDYPTIVCSDSKIKEILSSAEYFNSGIIVPYVHIIVRSDDKNLSALVADAFVDVVADAVEEAEARTRAKSVAQIQNHLLRLSEERKRLVSASRVVAENETELRRVDAEIESLTADVERVKSVSSNMELRVFRVRKSVSHVK